MVADATFKDTHFLILLQDSTEEFDAVIGDLFEKKSLCWVSRRSVGIKIRQVSLSLH